MIRSCTIFLLICRAVLLYAQDPFYINYDTKDGLPSSEIYDLEIDQNGLLWFTTDRGVVTYDGYEFHTFTIEDGLADNVNFEIFRDSENRLLFNGYKGALSIYEDGKFWEYPYSDSLLTIMEGKWIEHIVEMDSGSYVFTPSHSLKPIIFSLNESTPPQKLDYAIISEADSFDLKEEGIAYDLNNTIFSFFKEPIQNTFRWVNRLGVKINNSQLALTNNEVGFYSNEGVLLQSYSFDAIVDNYYLDKADNLWILTSKGLYFFKDADLASTPIRYFTNYRFVSMTQDFEGNYWLGTHSNGVFFVSSFDVKVLYPFEKSKKNSSFFSVKKLKEHIFFGATEKIISINKSGKYDEYYLGRNTDAQIRYLNDWDANTLFVNPKWVSENGNKLSFQQSKSIFLTNLLFKRKNDHVLSGIGNVNVLDSTGFIHFFKVSKKLFSIIEDQDLNIWLGTLDGAYKIIGTNYDSIVPVLTADNKSLGRVNNITLDKQGNVWLASLGNGLFCYTKNKLYEVSKQLSLNSTLINDVEISSDSIIWVATNKGVNSFAYHFENGQIITKDLLSLTTSDGLSSNYVNALEYWDGQMWLATNDGITYFNPDNLQSDFQPIQANIQQVIINDSIRSLESINDLKHDENDLLIDFTGISFRKTSDQPFYKYRLIRNEETPTWSFTNNKNVPFKGLLPGSYTFEVKARNKTGEWSTEPGQLQFKIKPHFTQTLWFKLLLILLGLLAIGLFVYTIVKRNKKRAEELSQLQKANLKTREAELAVLRNQMNPHFVFNSLNSVQYFIYENDVEKASYYLSKFSGLMRDSLQYSRHDLISLEEELKFLRNYLDLELMRFPDRFEYKIKVNEEFPVDRYMIPSLLLQPILENAVKHGFKNINYKGLLHIEVIQKNEELIEVNIKDNGPGLNFQTKLNNQRTAHKSLGLEIVQNRIDLLNQSKNDQVAKVHFENINNKAEKISGLLVRFILPVIMKV